MVTKPFVCRIDQSKFAQCETTSSLECGSSSHDQDMEVIFEDCRRCSEEAGDFVGWTVRAERTLKVAIPLRRLLAERSDAFDALKAEPWLQGRQRLLSRKKL